jgi:hypothetical protein
MRFSIAESGDFGVHPHDNLRTNSGCSGTRNANFNVSKAKKNTEGHRDFGYPKEPRRKNHKNPSATQPSTSNTPTHSAMQYENNFVLVVRAKEAAKAEKAPKTTKPPFSA